MSNEVYTFIYVNFICSIILNSTYFLLTIVSNELDVNSNIPTFIYFVFSSIFFLGVEYLNNPNFKNEKYCNCRNGISSHVSCEAIKNDKRIDITIFESGNLNRIKKNKERFNFKKSFKYSSEEFKLSKKKFLNNYKINETNFFLPNVNCLGGLSNFWGGGIEIPNKKFLLQRKLPLRILKEVYKVKII